MSREGKVRSSIFSGKGKDILLVSALAIVLLIACWSVFREDDGQEEPLSEAESRVMRILEEIDGVGEASVVVYERENAVQSVVIVCEGARDLQVVMNVREAVSALLGTEQKSVKIYLKKE